MVRTPRHVFGELNPSRTCWRSIVMVPAGRSTRAWGQPEHFADPQTGAESDRDGGAVVPWRPGDERQRFRLRGHVIGGHDAGPVEWFATAEDGPAPWDRRRSAGRRGPVGAAA